VPVVWPESGPVGGPEALTCEGSPPYSAKVFLRLRMPGFARPKNRCDEPAAGGSGNAGPVRTN